jgi:hypothetical protein
MTWRIDALDVHGGVAFATERNEDLNDESGDWRLNPEAPSVVLIAPFFVPEPTPNRGFGLAAARGAFQFGLFIDEGQEAPFASLDDLQEFVRRTYLRSSGGSDDAGGTLPPSPDGGGGEGGGPDFPLERGGGTIAQIQRWSKTFADAICQRKLGSPDVSELFYDVQAEDLSRPGLGDPLLAGMARLIWEMARRAPQAVKVDKMQAWSRSAAALGALIMRLGVAEKLANLFNRHHRGQAIDALIVFIAQKLNLSENIDRNGPGHFLVSFFVAAGLRLDHDAGRDLIFHGLPPWHLWWWNDDMHRWSQRDDALSLLQRLPVPDPARRLLKDASIAADDLTLAHLLAATLASPQTMTGSLEAMEMLLIAAAALTSEQTRETAGSDSLLSAAPSIEEAIVQGAVSWLRGAFPRIALAPELERIIEKDAIRTRYDNPEGHAPEPLQA